MKREVVKYTLCAVFDEDIVREVSKDEYEESIHNKNLVIFFLHFEELYEIVKENFREFWRTLFDIAEDYRIQILFDHSHVTRDISNLNLRIANILNSVKSYEDHLCHKLSTQFGKHNDIETIFRDITSEVYGNSFDYRFCVRLRNYTQHFSNPVKKISYSSFAFRKEPFEIAFTASPIAYKKELLEFDGWSTVRKDIEGMDDEIDLVPILEGFFRAFGFVHSKIRKEMDNIYVQSKKHIENLYLECKEYLRNKKSTDETSPSIVCHYDDMCFSYEWMPHHLINVLETYRTQNANWVPNGLSFTTLQASKNIKEIQNIFYRQRGKGRIDVRDKK